MKIRKLRLWIKCQLAKFRIWIARQWAKFRLWFARQWAKFQKFVYSILLALGLIVPIVVTADDVSLTWVNAVEWDDGTQLDPADLVSSTIKFQFFNLTDPPVPGGARNYIELVTVLATVTNYNHINLPNGVYCYVGFHTASNNEASIDSDETCRTVDVRVPGTLTGLTAN